MSLDERLDDLAFLYVGLAHGSDGRLHFNEFTQIADHLRRWQRPSDSRDVLELVENAIANYDANRVEDAVVRLATGLSGRERAGVMEDLSEIALADRRFLREEAVYILWVSRRWGIGQSDASGSFSTVLRAALAGF
ncbi:MAG: TerB family tellurite resistance protein [Rhodothermales bacterium]|nr:TerB family tellurite resistance protein [Rhodothermales bacterium]